MLKHITLIKKLFTIEGILTVVLTLLLASPLNYGAIEITESRPDKTVIPRGNEASVFYFRVKSTLTDETIESISLQNNGLNANFTNGVSNVTVYLDENNDTSYNEGKEKQLATLIPKTMDLVTIGSINQLIPSGNTVGFFITYTIEDTAQLSSTTNFELKGVQSTQGNSAALPATVKNSVTISGIKSLTVTDISPSITLPGSEDVPMLYLSILIEGENINSNMAINIINESSNFITTQGLKDGITKVSLYRDTIGDGKTNFEPAQSDSYPNIGLLLPTDLTSSSNVVFNIDQSKLNSIAADITINMILTYDIGSNFAISTDTKVNAQFTSFTGLGSQSALTISKIGQQPSTPAETFIAGLAFSDLVSIVPVSASFGPKNTASMLQFSLFGSHTAVTVNQISIKNAGTVPFITSEAGTDGIIKLNIYTDTNGNGVFDGKNSDSQLGGITLGDPLLAHKNQTDLAHVSVNITTNGYSIEEYISTKNYPLNNEKRLFVEYIFGDNIKKTEAKPVLNVTAELYNANAISLINDIEKELTLTGDLPAAADPEAIVTLSETNVHLINIVDISPDIVFQGEELVPMLAINLWSDVAFPSASITVDNTKNTFLPNSKGVSKVWVARDLNQNKTLDLDDPPIKATGEFTSTDQLTLNGIDIFAGDNNYLVLYDIGLDANTTVSHDIRCQLSGINGPEEAEIQLILGGNVPQPNEAAKVSTLPKKLTINKVIIEDFEEDKKVKDKEFTITLDIKNTTNDAITININGITPRFYLSGTDGKDITYEFSSNLSENDLTHRLPYKIAANKESDMFKFEAKHSNRLSSGQVFIDGFIKYMLTPTRNAIISRYESDNNWLLAAGSNYEKVTIETNQTAYSWSLPNYIDFILVQESGQSREFKNYDAVPSNSDLEINFKNNGQAIDESSLQLSINGTTITRNTEIAKDTYTYDRNEGRINISNLGTSNGVLTLHLKDLDGADLDSSYIYFYISSTIKISNFHFNPNPYHPQKNESLTYGFSTTQTGTYDLYIFNQIGTLVKELNNKPITTIGYQTNSFIAQDSFITSGMYIIKLIATDTGGNKSIATSKLAIY